MIYTVNLISIDRAGETTTTDITDRVSNGFSFIKRLDEELDVGSITLLNVERKEPYVIWDTIQVLIDDVEQFSMRIAGDNVSMASKNPKRYNHVLTLVEHTKLLELFTTSGLTFTQPTDGTTRYTIADVIERLFKVIPLQASDFYKISPDGIVNINGDFSSIQALNYELEAGGSVTVSGVMSSVRALSQLLSASGTVSVSGVELDTRALDYILEAQGTITTSGTESHYQAKNNAVVAIGSVTVTGSSSWERVIDLVSVHSGQVTVTGNLGYTYDPNPSPVEWVVVSSGTPTGGTCVVLADLGNIKSVITQTCGYVKDGSSYTSSTDLTNPAPTCFSGAQYTVCLPFEGSYVCQDYIGQVASVETLYECQLK